MVGPFRGPCLYMVCPCIAMTGQSSLTWSNLEQLAHGDASYIETGASSFKTVVDVESVL